MGNIETVLASSIVAVTWAAGVVSATMWYGSAAVLQFMAAVLVNRSCDDWMVRNAARRLADQLCGYGYVEAAGVVRKCCDSSCMLRSNAVRVGLGTVHRWHGT